MNQFGDYGRRHPYQRQFTAILQKEKDANPHILARAGIEAVFDHLMSPEMLDSEFPTEYEVDQVEGQLIAMVSEEADSLRALIRRPRPDDTV